MRCTRVLLLLVALAACEDADEILSFPPTLVSVSPATGSATGGTTITLRGTQFYEGATVEVGGAPATNVTVLHVTALRADVPASALPGTVDVTVTTVLGSATLAGAFTYVAPPPALASVTVAQGPTTGGRMVTLAGSGFQVFGAAGTNAVTFGGVAATNVTEVDDATLTCVTPAGTAGAADVEVTNANGTATKVGGYTYIAPNALEFDGVDDYVIVAADATLDLAAPLTLSVWYRHDASAATETLIVGAIGRYALRVDGDTVKWCITAEGGAETCLSSMGTLTVGAWHHLAGVYDSTEYRLYVDGQLDTTMTLSQPVATAAEPLYVGGVPGGPSVDGTIHEIRLWSVARTEAEIARDRFEYLAGTETGLVAYWRASEGTGQVVADLTAGTLDGQLGSTPVVDDNDPGWVGVTWPHPPGP